ncbi:branched-chain amino acid transport system substrate-binding protein [Geodermatophilus telluris]|uniref:Branched-chain amino acid transport system substrate-binding protein n=1 Tax=Geodermatophilus telluris TaxID=1190417 RepID=A0A1G6TS66_9ACTN|nr:ABC transporter substrate-binding protein [Geodermatophilus telluris]SDD31316.1 branched-chain amino acid transport system substrate-binding protein [Geodermatophilus telluris]
MAVHGSSRGRLLGPLGAVALLSLTTACGGGSLGGDSGGGDSGGGGGEGGGTIRVGLVIPQAGVYTPLGEDMQQGWDLWLEQNDGRMGDYQVETVVADEGEGPDTGVPAIQRLLQEEQVDVVVGIVNSATALGAAEQFTEAQKLLIVANAGAGAITGDAASPYVWRTSFTNAQVASAMGQHLAEEGVGPVYVMAPDYAAGQEVVAGFTEAFEAGGGTVAGQALTPFGTTQDYQPFLSGIRDSGAAATFVFYSGAEAVSFVQQYDAFGLKDAVPLYGSGFLTEGSVLEAQGQSAVGVQTTLHYSTEIDNEANTEFVEAYEAAYDEPPTVFGMTTYDTANVLADALAEAEGLTGDQLSEALDGLGEIEDSPRGPWSFNGQTPEQSIYLREVTDEGGTLVNSVVTDLGRFAQPGS